MPILYACVAQNAQIVSEFATQETGMRDTVQRLLTKIPAGTSRKTYKKEDYHFNYVAEAGSVFFCLTDAGMQARVAFAFLDDIKSRWGSGSAPSAFKDTLRDRMGYYSRPGADKITEVQAKVAEVKDVMLENIDALLKRGDQLETLDKKAEGLKQGAKDFKTRATDLARSMWWKNVKIWIIIIVIIIVRLLSGAAGRRCWTRGSHLGVFLRG